MKLHATPPSIYHTSNQPSIPTQPQKSFSKSMMDDARSIARSITPLASPTATHPSSCLSLTGPILSCATDFGGLIGSQVVAALPLNQRVELEFLQMRLPGEAPSDEGWVFVVPKLAPVTAAEERALVARWCRKLPLQGSFLAPHPLPPFCAPCAPPPPGGGT